jgi:hypothetical protein
MFEARVHGGAEDSTEGAKGDSKDRKYLGNSMQATAPRDEVSAQW